MKIRKGKSAENIVLLFKSLNASMVTLETNSPIFKVFFTENKNLQKKK